MTTLKDLLYSLFEKKAKTKKFYFKYQQYPFDDFHKFSVLAEDQEKANALATEEFKKMFETRVTVMTVFYPIG